MKLTQSLQKLRHKTVDLCTIFSISSKALRSIMAIGFFIKIWFESIILQLLKSNFKAIFLIHLKLSKLAVFC